MPAVIVPEPPPMPSPPRTAPTAAKPGGEGRIEIVLTRGRRILVDAGVDADALARVLEVLERR